MRFLHYLGSPLLLVFLALVLWGGCLGGIRLLDEGHVGLALAVLVMSGVCTALYGKLIVFLVWLHKRLIFLWCQDQG